jgi:Coenzyme PQQ synthesis protein D (PqqD)
MLKHALSMATHVRIPESIAVHDLQGELLLLNSATGVCVSLDLMGTRMWQLLHEHHALHKVLDALLHEYAVTEAQAEQDLLGFVARMLEQGFVETVAEETS